MKNIKIRRTCKGRGGSLEYSTHAPLLKAILKGTVRALSHVKDTFETLSIDDLRHSSTSVLFLSLVRGSGANQGAAIFWQLIEMSGLSGSLYRVV